METAIEYWRKMQGLPLDGVRPLMQASTDTRLIQCLDGLALSFEMLEYVHSELHKTCSQLTSQRNALAIAFLQCWSFVDIVHRIRELAQAVPGLGAKNPELRAFLDAASIAEPFRHYIQHLRRELSKSPGYGSPVWGSLSWVDAANARLIHTALAGAHIRKTQYKSCVFDFQNREWVSKVALGIIVAKEGVLTLNFDPMAAACVKFREFIIPWIVETYEPGIQVSAELPIASVFVQLD